MHNEARRKDETLWDLTALGPDRAGGTKRKGSRAWLFGAYTFLVVWGAAYLVLLFTNRLPI